MKEALSKYLADHKRQEGAILLSIKLGTPGLERQLASLLEHSDNKDLAKAYLNSGSAILELAADKWARKHGFTIAKSSYGAVRFKWGNF